MTVAEYLDYWLAELLPGTVKASTTLRSARGRDPASPTVTDEARPRAANGWDSVSSQVVAARRSNSGSDRSCRRPTTP